MNEFDKTNEQDVSKGNKRRSFLKKSATGAVVFSLPAKSVWGACSVSGAMSGNLSTNADRHDCTMGAQGGRSPGYWKTCLANDNLHAVFVHLKIAKDSVNNNSTAAQQTAYQTTKNCYRSAVESVMSHTMVLPSEFNPLVMTVEEGLNSEGATLNNLYFHMAAVYLNSYFGLYTNFMSESVVTSQEAIGEVFLFWYMGDKSASQLPFHSDYLDYDAANTITTTWQPSSC